MGSAIHPIAGGIVEAVTQDNRAGRWVKVKHPDGTTSTYAHMGDWSVKVGDEVTANTVLGTVGLTGHTTGAHLHLRIRDKNGQDLDPEKVIGGKAGQGSVVGSTTAARNYDQAAVISNIKAMGLSPEREERAIKRARQRMQEAEDCSKTSTRTLKIASIPGSATTRLRTMAMIRRPVPCHLC
jgi:murein DD-endopeptidase MepM/ murein hydrolase activator NlpD